jgi:orotidine-5'-phosphate decarboxylase
LTRISIPSRERLIFAMDVADAGAARALAERLGDSVQFYKLGLELFMAGGYFELLDWMVARGKQVFVDLKFFDVPATVGAAVRNLAGRGVTFATVHGNQGIMEAAAAAKGDVRVWHLATHGFFYADPDALEAAVETVENDVLAFRGGGRGMHQYSAHRDPMMRSGIVFAGVNDQLETDNGEGVLTASEVEWLPLHNAELVVLSACETGLGDISGNEGVYGLQRAFRIAGAQKLIMSLWQVPDNETREFFGYFYDQYATNGDASAAIRYARSQMSKKYDPYYWAAFVLVN